MTKAISFPNRPCPGCGKPIHIKSRSHDCGWTAAATAASSPAASTSPKETSNGAGISKREAVRRILAAKGDSIKPLEIQDQLKKKYDITMDSNVISNYKSNILRDRGTEKKAEQSPERAPARSPGRPRKTAPDAAPTAARSHSTEGISLDDVEAVKKLAHRLGAEQLRRLANILAQ